jgi:hypothetical protein
MCLHSYQLSGVCSEWKAAYAGVADQQVHAINIYRSSCKLVTCGPRTTLYSTAVASPASARRAARCGLIIDEKLQHSAGLYADAQTVSVLRELGMPLDETVVRAVAVSGRLNILQHLLLEQQGPRPARLSYYAARSGSISMLKWPRAESWCEFDSDTCEGAADEGHLAALQHLRSEGCAWHQTSIAGHAASSGNIQLIEWLRQQGIELNVNTLPWAAAAGKTAMCEHLRSAGCDWDDHACSQAASYGHIATLRWL